MAAVFEGRKDRIEGDYCLVIWENAFLSIALGREVLGAPKIFADIPDPWSRGNSRGWTASENAYPLCEGQLSELRTVPTNDAERIAKQTPRPWMGWKYIPSIDRASSDISYPTLLPSFQIEKVQAWTGNGHVRFFPRRFEEAPVGYLATSTLARLPLLEVKASSMITASMTMIANDCRRLE
jgi:hypothetical protein